MNKRADFFPMGEVLSRCALPRAPLIGRFRCLFVLRGEVIDYHFISERIMVRINGFDDRYASRFRCRLE